MTKTRSGSSGFENWLVKIIFDVIKKVVSQIMLTAMLNFFMQSLEFTRQCQVEIYKCSFFNVV